MPIVIFCETYLGLAGDMALLGKLFVIAALVAALANALFELIARLRPAPALQEDMRPDAPPVKDVVTALKDLVTALATAPLWLGLFAVGTTIFWIAGAASPDQCRAKALYTAERSGDGTGSASRNAASTDAVNTNIAGNLSGE